MKKKNNNFTYDLHRLTETKVSVNKLFIELYFLARLATAGPL